MQFTSEWKRTHTCGDLHAVNDGAEVVLNGWVDSVRDHGGLIFVNLRDRYGVTQFVFDPDHAKDAVDIAKELRNEDVISVRGKVRKRPDGQKNPNMPTGEIEVLGAVLNLLNRSEVPPFVIKNDTNASEELRLKYRYLDLRRPVLQDVLIKRHKAAQIARNYLSERDFLEIETPVLTKSTPEGARDYLVPSRVQRGMFFALPQSPQLFKQLLMVAGFDKYFQIVKCYRDEDLRADRQPEFTQIDIEASFIDREFIYDLIEGMIVLLWKNIAGVTFKSPFDRMPYSEAMDKYGNDRPDRRIPWLLHEVTSSFGSSGFKAFDDVVASGGVVKGFSIPDRAAEFSRKDQDAATEFVKTYGAKGVAVLKIEGGELKSGVAKFMSEDVRKKLINEFDLADSHILFLIADKSSVANAALSALRLDLGKRYKAYDEKAFDLVWVTDFPMLEWSEEGKRFMALHHPFTSPHPDDVHLLDSEPGKARALAYDLVMNGVELGGGSIRIHSRELQEKVFKILGIGAEEAVSRFGFLLEALQFGAPPHGGVAFGFDRILMLMTGAESIRDTIAFPKTTAANCLMTGAPSPVDTPQLNDLGISLIKK